MSDRTRLYADLANTRTADGSDEDGTAAIFFDYYADPILGVGRLSQSPDAARSRRLLLRAGYSYTAPKSQAPPSNSAVFEATWRVPLPGGFLLGTRNRFDLNIEAGEFDPRYRNRTRLDREITIEKFILDPYFYAEFFYGFNAGSWIKTRVTGGLELHAWSWIVPEVYFQRDHFTGSTRNVEGFGLVVNIYLK